MILWKPLLEMKFESKVRKYRKLVIFYEKKKIIIIIVEALKTAKFYRNFFFSFWTQYIIISKSKIISILWKLILLNFQKIYCTSDSPRKNADKTEVKNMSFSIFTSQKNRFVENDQHSKNAFWDAEYDYAVFTQIQDHF